MIILGSLILCNLSFPGTFNFIAELLCFICLLEVDCYLFYIFIIIICGHYGYWFIIMNKSSITSIKWYIMNSMDYVVLFIILYIFILFFIFIIYSSLLLRTIYYIIIIRLFSLF